MIKNMLHTLFFSLKDNACGVYQKKYNDGTIIEVDLEKNLIDFGGIKIYDKVCQNIVKPEDSVVLECVDRLLTKWYKASDILLEKVYPTWRGTSWRLDILVKKEDKAFLMIECKTRGSEFDKEFKKMSRDGGQLFTYFQQDRDAEYLMLYTSCFNDNEIYYKNEIVKIEESYRETSNVEDLYLRWNKFTKNNWVFDAWVVPYHFESKALTKKDLIKIKQEDSSLIFNSFLEILRHNTVSDKPNAFNKMFTLFLCKIYDEWHKWDDEELEFQWKEWVDDDVSFQVRLTDLYKRWMLEFLKKEITDFNNDEFNKEFGDIDEQTRNKILYKITKLRLEKNNEFAIKEVFDADTFKDNAIVLKEVVELLQTYQIRYAEKQPFLGDFFELLLTTWLKQESGQFFTPVPIARFICKSIPLDRIIQSKIDGGDTTDLLPATIDYAAGSGHFLTESMEEIQNIIHAIDESQLKPNVAREIKKWQNATFDRASEYMYGIEKDYRLVKTAKVGCYLHGDGIATVIHGDGLDSFAHSKNYRGRLKNAINKENQQYNEQFDLVLSNPPYSVSAFKWNLDREKAEQDFDLYQYLTERSSEIECLFIERTKQLLKEWGIAALVLPSSILSNSGIYTKAREILLRDFDILSIVSLGSGTFMATGTNTVVLFMKKRDKYFARNMEASVGRFFSTMLDVSLNGIEQVFSKWSSEVWWVRFEDYKTLCAWTPNEAVQYSEMYQEYSKNLKVSKNENLVDAIIAIEKEKIVYFVLTYNQQLVLVKSWEKQIEKEFLWYEFSNRKWSEGIHPIQWGKLIDECTKLFDPAVLNNPEKVSTYIYDAFIGRHDRVIHEALKPHVLRTRLVDLITFDRVEFEKTVSTNIKKKIKLESKWKWIKVEDSIDPVMHDVVKIQKKEVKSMWTYPVISQEKDKVIWYTDLNNPINELPLIIFWDHNKVFKYIDYQFFVWADGVKLLKPKKEFLPKYFYFILESIKFEWIQNYQRHYSILKNIQIPCPPLDIQQKIVEEIWLLEQKEQENNEKVKSLKKEVENLFEISVLEWTKTYRLTDGDVFDLSIWKRLLKSQILSFWSYPVFSANVFEPFGYVNQLLITDFSKSSVLWWIDGERMVNYIKQNIPFYPTDHCWFVRIKNWVLNERFVAYFLNKEWKAFGFSRANRASLERIQGIKLNLPPLSVQQKIVTQIEAIEAQIAILEAELKKVPWAKHAVLVKFL
jgi:type I restriction enzyme M protein